MNTVKRLKLKLTKTVSIFCINLFVFNTSYSEKLEFNTKYFRVVYDDNLVREADILNKKADKIAENIFKDLDFEFSEKEKITLLVLNGNVENAYVVTFNPGTIVLYPNTLVGNSFNKTYGTWIDTVLTHELVHTVLAKKSSIKIANLRPFAIFLPSWLHEGSAVYLETKYANGRGHQNLFKNIPKSFNDLKFEKIALNPSNVYILGYSFLDSYSKKHGEENLFATLRECSINSTISNINSFKDARKEVNNWNKIEKQVKIGEKFHNSCSYRLKGYNDTLIFKDDDGYLCKLNVKNKKIIRKKLVSLDHFNINEGNLSVVKVYSYFNIWDRYFEGINRACFINNSLINSEEIKMAAKYNDEIIYVVSSNGHQELKSDKRGILISKDENMIFQELMFSKEGIFFLAANYYDKGSYIFTLKDENIFEICEANSASLFQDKIYLAKDEKDKISIFEYSITDNKLRKLVEGDTLANPVRINDILFFNQYDEGFPYIYKVEMDEIEESNSINIIESRYKNNFQIHKRPKSKKYIPKIELGFPNFMLNLNFEYFEVTPFFVTESRKFSFGPIFSFNIRNNYSLRKMGLTLNFNIMTVTGAYFPESNQFGYSAIMKGQKVIKPLNAILYNSFSYESLPKEFYHEITLSSDSVSLKHQHTLGIKKLNLLTKSSLSIENAELSVYTTTLNALKITFDENIGKFLQLGFLANLLFKVSYNFDLSFPIKKRVDFESIIFVDKILFNVKPGFIFYESEKDFLAMNNQITIPEGETIYYGGKHFIVEAALAIDFKILHIADLFLVFKGVYIGNDYFFSFGATNSPDLINSLD